MSDEHRTGAEQEVDIFLARGIANAATAAFGDDKVGARVSEASSRKERPRLLTQRGDRVVLHLHARSPVTACLQWFHKVGTR